MPYEVFKKLDPSDYTVTPFEAHKKYTISDENATSNGLIVREGGARGRWLGELLGDCCGADD